MKSDGDCIGNWSCNIVLEGANEILFKAMKNGDRNLA